MSSHVIASHVISILGKAVAQPRQISVRTGTEHHVYHHIGMYVGICNLM